MRCSGIDVLLGPDGKMVIVGNGRYLGIGDKDIAVRFSVLSLQSDERDKSGRLVIDVTKEALQQRPLLRGAKHPSSSASRRAMTRATSPPSAGPARCCDWRLSAPCRSMTCVQQRLREWQRGAERR